jgi:nucleotide-binding universal stress UspA family protein
VVPVEPVPDRGGNGVGDLQLRDVPDPGEEKTGFHSMVCALSPSAISGEYVNETVALSAVFRSKLTFASAVTPDSGAAESSRVLTLEEEYAEAGLDQLVGGSKCAVYVEGGPVGHVVRHIAERQSADLVIISRRHTPDFGQHTHGHACEIVLESPCPVLSLPTKANAAAMHLFVENYHQGMYAMYARA